MSKESTLHNLATKLNRLVLEEVSSITNRESKYKNAFEELCIIIVCEMEDAKLLMDNYKQEGFTSNSIEAEGAYRAWLTCFNRSVEIKGWFKE